MEKEWFLAIQEHNTKTQANMLRSVRVISEDELGSIEEATKLLRENLEDSPYARLTEDYEAFKLKIKEISDNSDGRSQSPQNLKQVSKLLDNLLSSLRAFDDRTTHNLSQRYGKDSKEFALFKSALSEEFDNTFAYRFACQLRNYSQHTGSTITNIHASSHINGISYCNPVFDSKVLLEKYSKWQSQVKKDLKAIKGEISAITVVDSMMASCTKAYSKLLLETESDLRAAMELIDKFLAEALKAANRGADLVNQPILLEMTKGDDGNYIVKTLNIRYLRSDLVKNAESAYRQAHSILGGLTH